MISLFLIAVISTILSRKKRHFFAKILVIGLLLFPVFLAQTEVVFAQTNSILPTTDSEGAISCLDLREKLKDDPLAGQYLAKKIVCGRMTLPDIPYYVKHALNFFFGIIGTLAVLAVMRAGVYYMIAKDKDSGVGKKALQASVIGLVVFLSSFALARIFSYLLTAS